MSKYDELISRYEKGIELFEQALRNVSPSEADKPRGEGKWTPRQIAAHVADSELVGAVRIRWIAAEPGSPLKAYDQDKWASALDYTTADVSESLDLFRAARRTTVRFLRALPEEAWSRTAIHEERGELTLARMVELCAEHAESHSRQIRERAQAAA